MKQPGRLWFILTLAVVAAAGIGWLLATRRTAPSATPPAPTPVTGSPRSSRELVLHGRVEAAKRLTVSAPAEGTVVALLHTVGNPVGEGQPLLQINSPALQSRLRAAREKLDRARQHQTVAQQTTTSGDLATLEQALRDAAIKSEQTHKALENFSRAHGDAQSALDRYAEAKANATSVSAAYQRASAAYAKVRQTAPGAGGDQQAASQAARVVRNYRALLSQNNLAQNQLAEARKILDGFPNEAEQLRTLRRIAADADRRKQELGPRVEQARARQDKLTQARQGADVKPAQAAVTTAEAAAAACQVKAPRSGLLSELAVKPGAKVVAGQKLAVIELAGGARLVLQAQPSDLPQLSVGQNLTLETVGGTPRPARVTQLDAQGPTVRVYVTVLDTQPLPGPEAALLGRFRRH